MSSTNPAQSGRRADEGSRSAFSRRFLVPREPGVVVFRCERCGAELRDLRGVFLAHRGGGWRIECSRHDDAEYAIDGGILFGGGLHAVAVLADLARARWFEPGDLFRAILRLRAQESGLYFDGAPATG